MNENKFTPRAEAALRLSQEAAGDLGHGYVGTEHLLLGLLREEDGVAHDVLAEAGLTAGMVVEIIKKSVGAGLPGGNPAQGLTPRAKRVVEIAMEDSIRGGCNYIGTEHLLAGILREGNNMAVRILRTAGVDARGLYSALMRKLSEQPRSKAGEAKGAAPREEKGKNLREFTRDLTADARAGRLDPVIGRDEEIQRMIQILSRRTKNNPCLIGEPGVGKTALAEGLARKIVLGDVPEDLLDKRILSLDLSGMVAGTKYRGEFEALRGRDPLHRRAPHHRGCRQCRGRRGRRQHHQARPGPGRDPGHRRHDPERVPQIYRKGRRPGAPVPAGAGGGALQGGLPGDPEGPAGEV